MKKNSCTAINPKKYSCYGLKKFIFDNNNKKNPAARKFPTPFHNFTTTTTTNFIENWKITNYITFPPANSL